MQDECIKSRMDICLVGKYPPIQGGVSRATFWMAHALAANGINVHVVTNAEEVEDEFALFDLAVAAPDLDLYATPSPAPGMISVHSTRSDRDLFHIPWTKPFVSKIASLATEVVTEYDCSLIHAYYLEPYGMAAYLASTWTGVPFGLQHAGSDIGRLFQNEQLTTSYQSVIAAADYLVLSSQLRDLIHRVNLDPDRLYAIPAALPPQSYFNPDTPRLDIGSFQRAVKEWVMSNTSIAGWHEEFSSTEYRAEYPSIGIYGKLGHGKGIPELVAALGLLRRSGVEYNFLVLGQDTRERMNAFASLVVEHGIYDRTILLPFIPHWHVPHFIRTCDAVCALESGFPIAFHTPSIPIEVVACGTCLIMSPEIAGKQLFHERIRSGTNCFVVDPSDSSSLAATIRRVLSDRARDGEIGRRGLDELLTLPGTETYGVELANAFLEIEREAHERRRLVAMRDEILVLRRIRDGRDLGNAFSDQLVKELDGKYRRELGPHLLKRARNAYKLSFAVLKGEVRRIFQLFLDRVSPISEWSPTDLVLRFADDLLSAVGGLPEAPPYTADLIRYEKHRFILSLAGCSTQRRPQNPPGVQPGDRLTRSPWIELVSVKYDIPSIVERLRGEADVDAETVATNHLPRDGWLIFKRVYQDELEPDVLYATEATKEVIDLCNGIRTAVDVVDETKSRFRISADSEAYGVINGLLQNGCVEIAGQRPMASPIETNVEAESNGTQTVNDWKSINLCVKTYPKRVVNILMCKNRARATFLLREDDDRFVLRYKPLNRQFTEKDIIDELNYLIHVEEQRALAEPIRREILRGLVNKFSKD